METATSTVASRSAADPSVGPRPVAPSLRVAARYLLSEDGRKAALLAGGDGRAQQQIFVDVPATRLHLVTVDADGTARLKLQPRYEADGDRILRHDTPPSYDVPPTIDDLYKEAARNYELERTYRTERSATRAKRRDAERESRTQLAQTFLADPTQRAMVHPAPSPKRCFLATPRGRVMFETSTDEGPAKELPVEAHRRFRADLRARKERNQQQRAEQLALHEEKKQVVAAWITEHGTAEQQARQAAGVLPIDEAIVLMSDHAFADLGDRPLYARDGAERLQRHLHASGYPDAVVAQADLVVTGTDAVKATASQWALVQELQTALPDAKVVLRTHRLSWRRDANAPSMTLFGVLVTRKIGPFLLRREFAAPND